MDYKRIYDSLLLRAETRSLAGYSELHHIVPRCMGGGDDPENLVRLTPEEHFLAHKLLVQIFPSNSRLAFAMLAMTMDKDGARPNNKLFGWARRRLARENSIRKKGVARPREIMERVWAATRGRIVPDDERARNSEAHKGRPHSPEHNAKVAAAIRGMRGIGMTGLTHSEETKEKIRAKALGRKHTPETKAKLVAIASAYGSARALKAWETKRRRAAK